MKVFVTGSSGYLGKPLVEALKQKHTVVGYDIVLGNDVLNYSKLSEAMKDCEVVVHTAAIPKPIESKTFDDYFQLNCVGTMNVVKAAIENKVSRLVFISSTGYYGVERGVPVKLPVKEDSQILSMYVKADELSCNSSALMYSESKVIGENILAFYGLSKKIQVVCLRLPRIGDKDGPYETRVSMVNAVSGIISAVEAKEVFWFEAFNIADNVRNVDISKAKKVLNYSPL